LDCGGSTPLCFLQRSDVAKRIVNRNDYTIPSEENSKAEATLPHSKVAFGITRFAKRKRLTAH
jgi:hypothetical protein